MRIFLLTVLGFLMAFSQGLGGTEDSGFRLPSLENRPEGPRALASHPAYRLEWWYLTGHLRHQGKPVSEGDDYGFQLTFFRFSEKPGQAAGPQDTVEYQEDPAFLSHGALLDIENQEFMHQEMVTSAGPDAWASTDHLDVQTGPWYLRAQDPDSVAPEMKAVFFPDPGLGLELKFFPTKGPLWFGKDGISMKSASTGAASYYLNFPRLRVEGMLKKADGEVLPVEGSAWLDHEISTNQLRDEHLGWDWTGIQLDDGREIKAFRLRLKEGGDDSFSSIAWVLEDGSLVQGYQESFSWIREGWWLSPKTGARYPISPIIETADPENGKKRRLQLVPLMENQEIPGEAGGIAYWEGACQVIDLDSGKSVGKAYLEMTGYAGGIGDRL